MCCSRCLPAWAHGMPLRCMHAGRPVVDVCDWFGPASCAPVEPVCGLATGSGMSRCSASGRSQRSPPGVRPVTACLVCDQGANSRKVQPHRRFLLSCYVGECCDAAPPALRVFPTVWNPRVLLKRLLKLAGRPRQARAHSKTTVLDTADVRNCSCRSMSPDGAKPLKLSICGASQLTHDAVSALLRLPVLIKLNCAGCNRIAAMDRMRLIAKIKAGREQQNIAAAAGGGHTGSTQSAATAVMSQLKHLQLE